MKPRRSEFCRASVWGALRQLSAVTLSDLAARAGYAESTTEDALVAIKADGHAIVGTDGRIYAIPEEAVQASRLAVTRARADAEAVYQEEVRRLTLAHKAQLQALKAEYLGASMWFKEALLYYRAKALEADPSADDGVPDDVWRESVAQSVATRHRMS